MTFRGLAMFSLAVGFGSLGACRPSASMRPAPSPIPPPLSVPAPSNPAMMTPPAIVPSEPANLSPPIIEPEPEALSDNPWKPAVPNRDWTSIVIHHTATDQGSVESIHEAHLAREWLGIGYHFVIGNGNGMPDGEIAPTFRWREQLHGAHAGAEEFNQHGIGIALVGNFEKQPPTPAQLASIKRLVAVLKSEYHIDGEHVIGHREVKATACPGKLFPIEQVREVAVSSLSRPARSAKTIHAAKHNAPAAGLIRTADEARNSQRSAMIADLSGSRLQ